MNKLGRLHSNGDVKSMRLLTASGDEKALFIHGHSNDDGFEANRKYI